MPDQPDDRRPSSSPGEEEPPVIIRDKRKFDSDGNLRVTNMPGRPAPSAAASELRADEEPIPAGTGGFGGPGAVVNETVVTDEVATQLIERTADLQRLTAEYANYRKRVDRDRIVVGEIAVARVLEKLLPVLDDLDRADEHGDLTGAFKAVADKLNDALTSLGLSGFGVAGDPFDPGIHEAVMHSEGDGVSTPTATTIMRKGYRLNERLLRPAMVGVTDPAAAAPTE